VDAAITFDELEELFKLKNITLKTCEESSLIRKYPEMQDYSPLKEACCALPECQPIC
jgi:iron only hydrogenase large subunit-like protein